MTLTQTERVRRALEKFPVSGITQADFQPGRVIDNGAPISRLGARINDLKRAGVKIGTDGRRDGFTVYVLLAARRSEVRYLPGDDGTPGPDPRRILTPPPLEPATRELLETAAQSGARSAIYGDDC